MHWLLLIGLAHSACLESVLERLPALLEESLSDTQQELRRDRVAAIYNNPKLSVKDKARKAFAEVLQIKLHGLPDEIQDAVENVKLEAVPMERDIFGLPILNGEFFPYEDRIEVSIPGSLYGTEVEYLVRYHELIHLITEKKTDRIALFPKGKRSKISTANNVSIRYQDEAISMAEEWKYVDSLPQEIRSQSVERIRSSPFFHGKSFLIDLFENHMPTPEGHLDYQRLRGRYTENKLYWQFHTRARHLTISALALGYAAYSIASIGPELIGAFWRLYAKED